MRKKHDREELDKMKELVNTMERRISSLTSAKGELADRPSGPEEALIIEPPGRSCSEHPDQGRRSEEISESSISMAKSNEPERKGRICIHSPTRKFEW